MPWVSFKEGATISAVTLKPPKNVNGVFVLRIQSFDKFRGQEVDKLAKGSFNVESTLKLDVIYVVVGPPAALFYKFDWQNTKPKISISYE